jgi:peptide/nickel transport system substrate-binding protein
MDLDKNAELPTVAAFKVTVPYPATRCVAERNPYYWKVDTAGNQLPYIDRITYAMAFDNTILNLKALNGETDFQIRRIDAGNYTLFKERGRELGYRVMTSPSTNPTCVYLNQCSRNERMRPLLQDRRFRQALSLAIDRRELIDLVYSGLAEPSSGFIVPDDPYFVEGLDKANTEFDTATANSLLDELGMKRGDDGMRRMPDGSAFSEIIHIHPSEEGTNRDLWQLVAEYWRDVGLRFAVKHEDSTLSFMQVTAGNTEFWSYVNGGLHWAIEGLWKAPVSKMTYMAPLYGTYYASNGTQGVKPPSEQQQLLDWWLEMRATPDDSKRLELGRKVLAQWAQECYVVGICRPPIVSIVNDRLRNVPDAFAYDYRLKSPGYLQIEQFYFSDAKAER